MSKTVNLVLKKSQYGPKPGSIPIFGPIYLNQSIWTCLFRPVFLDLTIWTRIFGHAYLDPSIKPVYFNPSICFYLFGSICLDSPYWTHLFEPVYLDSSIWTRLFWPPYLDLSIQICWFDLINQWIGKGSKKHRKSWEKLPWELVVCQGVKVFFTKRYHYAYFCHYCHFYYHHNLSF